MIPKITSEDTHQAWAERQEENARQLKQNRYYAEALTAHQEELKLKVAELDPTE